MAWEIEYTDRWTGERKVHRFNGNRMGAQGWLKTLHAENGGKATLHDNNSRGNQPRREIQSVGDSSDPIHTPPRRLLW